MRALYMTLYVSIGQVRCKAAHPFRPSGGLNGCVDEGANLSFGWSFWRLPAFA